MKAISNRFTNGFQMRQSENDPDISENENNSESVFTSAPQSQACLQEIQADSSSSLSELSSSTKEQSDTCEILNEKYLKTINSTDSLIPNLNSEFKTSTSQRKHNENEHCEIINKNYLQYSQTSSVLAKSSPKLDSLSPNDSLSQLSPVLLPLNKPLNIPLPSNISSSSLTPEAKPSLPGYSTEMLSPLSVNSSGSSLKLNLVEKVKPFLKTLTHPCVGENKTFTELEYSEEENSGGEEEEGHLLMKAAKSESVNSSFPKSNCEDKSKSNISEEKECDCLRENVQDKTLNLSSTLQPVEAGNMSTRSKWVEEKILSESDEESFSSNQREKSAGNFPTQRLHYDNPLTCRQAPQRHITAYDAEILKMLEDDNLEARYPLVQWHQSDHFVWLNIKLPDLKYYRFTSDYQHIKFRAVYEQMLYRVDLKLYGGHKPETVACTSKAFYFEVRLEKLIKGKNRHWPQLTESTEKLHWIKINIEKAFEQYEEPEDLDLKLLACSRNNWNENPIDSESEVTDCSEIDNSELSVTFG